ncbi:hypothetical protein SDC9_185291 [bioreactor metagenome]|uniref:Uncharacterized protein n=1 Tax=bioreactor metagenome TaxID=1076179 RepID=A0A645HGB7_9ZZZZ
MGSDDAVDDGDESAGRAADLHPRTAEQRNDQAGDDGGPDAGGRRHPGGNGEGHRQRQRENADSDPGAEVLAELGPVVSRQAIQQLGTEGDLHHDAHSGREALHYMSMLLIVNVNRMLISRRRNTTREDSWRNALPA